VFNDVDGELVNLFHCIRDRFEEFLVELGLFPLNSREEFNIWLEEVGLGPYDTIQMTVSRGRLIIEPTDAPQNMICYGNCRRCPGAEVCEALRR